MDRSTRLPHTLALPAFLSSAALALRLRAVAALDALRRGPMDADERYVRGAENLADLEHRLKQLERGRARGDARFDAGH